MTEATKLICPRHKVETPLTCVTCETPICPQCYVRTAVGLRCPVCAQGVTVKLRGRPKWPIAVVAALAVLGLAVFALTRGGSDEGGSDQVAGEDVPPAPEGGPAAGYRLETRTAQGYSVEVPVQWQAQPDNSDTTLSYAEARPTEGSLRVSTARTDLTVADHVARLTEQLTSQGGMEFVETQTQISGVPAMKLDYRFPSTPTPGSALSSRTSYLVVRNGQFFSFQLATTDPGAKGSVFAYMASKFTLL